MPTDSTLERCRIPRSEIIRQADNLTFEYRSQRGIRASLGIDLKYVYEELIYPRYEVKLIDHLDLEKDEYGDEILGKYDPITNHLFLTCWLRNDSRYVFTFWHELGHVVLHGEWLRRYSQLSQHRPLIQTTDRSLSATSLHEIEVQANVFASFGAAPSWLLAEAFERTFVAPQIIFTGPQNYSFCLKGMPTQQHYVHSHREMCSLAAMYLKRYFGGLSREALGYRIEGTKLVLDGQANPQLPKLHRTAKKPITNRSSAL